MTVFTARYALPKPAGTDPADAPTQVGALADAIDSTFARVMGVTSRASNSATITATETLVDSVTFTAQANRRYKVTWTGVVSLSTGGNNGEVRLRFAAGASVTNAGTLIGGTLRTAAVNTENLPVTVIHTTTSILAGQVTVGAFGIVSTGAGNIVASAGSTFPTELIVEDIT